MFVIPLVSSIIIFYFLRINSLLTLSLLGPIGVLYYRHKISNKYSQLQLEYEQEFINGMNYLRIYLSNGTNVYSSFQILSQHLKPWFKSKVEEMLARIDEDKSISPYIKLANYFQNPLIEEIMIAIFQLNESGNSLSDMWQFNHLFMRYEQSMQELKAAKTLAYYERVAMLPLFASGLLIVGVSIGIITVIGDMIHGL